VVLPPDGESATVKVRFTAAEAGARVFRFKVPVQTRAGHAEQCARRADAGQRSRREGLYYEGEPRPEMKFVSRALEPTST